MHARAAVKAPYHLWVALALTWIAGFVDVVGYIVLYRVFVANMTGNTIALRRGLAVGDWGLLLRRGFAIPMFVLGLIVSRLVLTLSGEHSAPRAAGVLFGVEVLLLGAFLISRRMAELCCRGSAWCLPRTHMAAPLADSPSCPAQRDDPLLALHIPHGNQPCASVSWLPQER
jgi:hypothetical protein